MTTTATRRPDGRRGTNAWTCFLWGLVLCAVLLAIVWVIG